MRTTTVRAAVTAALTLAESAAIPMTTPQDMRFKRVWEGRPHGRGWPVFAELPDGYPHKYILLTMDR